MAMSGLELHTGRLIHLRSLDQVKYQHFAS